MQDDFRAKIVRFDIQNIRGKALGLISIGSLKFLMPVEPLIAVIERAVRKSVRNALAQIRERVSASTVQQRAFDELMMASGNIAQAGKILDVMSGPVFELKTIREKTYLFEASGESYFHITQGTAFPIDYKTTLVSNKKGEIKFLDSLKIPYDRKHVVQAGDNLWKIAERYYGNGRLFLLIAGVNNLRRYRVNPGSVLKIPIWAEICDLTKNKDEIVRYRDSLWRIADRKKLPWRRVKATNYSGRPSLIYPYELSPIGPRK